MNKILVLGAGRSSSVLIDYLLKKSIRNNFKVTVADISLKAAEEKINNHINGSSIEFSIENDKDAKKVISEHDIIISLLPPAMHDKVLVHCIDKKKHLLTASYINENFKSYHDKAIENDLLIMGEMGLDPGIDHMSAMKIIHELKDKNASIISFKSSTGGLVAPESDTNPWHYKVTWNPRNVVLAGSSTAQYLENNKVKYLPYNRIFTTIEKIKLKGYGIFESYANRDSLSYEDLYELHGIPTLLRATLRRENYCASWNVLVQLGLTDDTYKVNNANKLTYKEWLNSYLPVSKEKNIEKSLSKFMKVKSSDISIKNIKWLGLLSDYKIPFQTATPAQIIQDLIEKKWKMEITDHDMIVMVHEFIYKLKNKKYKLTSSLIVKGENQIHTAMAKTVGLPLGMLAIRVLNNTIKQRGVLIPVMKEVYTSILTELAEEGIIFNEEIKLVK